MNAHLNLSTLAIAALLAVANASIHAATITVHVSGLADASGRVGCALFATPNGFPMDNTQARQQWMSADLQGVACRFDNVEAGRYAVSVAHDANSNGLVDTNLFGIPREAWGVSNNVRHALQAPRWEEAAFAVADNDNLTLSIKVSK